MTDQSRTTGTMNNWEDVLTSPCSHGLCPFGLSFDANNDYALHQTAGFDSEQGVFNNSFTADSSSTPQRTTITSPSTSGLLSFPDPELSIEDSHNTVTSHGRRSSRQDDVFDNYTSTASDCMMDPSSTDASISSLNNGQTFTSPRNDGTNYVPAGPQQNLSYDDPPVPAHRTEHASYSPQAVQNNSLHLLLPVSSANGTTRQSSHLWDQDNQVPRFMLATHKEQKAVSRTGKSKVKSRVSILPPEWTWVPQQPERSQPRGQLTMIRQIAMKNWLHANGGDNRLKKGQKREAANGTDDTSPPRRSPKRGSTSNRADHNNMRLAVDDMSTSIHDGNTVDNTVILSGSTDDEQALQGWQKGVVWHAAPSVMYSPFFTMENMTIYYAEPLKEMQLPINGLACRTNQFNEWPEFPLHDGEAERLKYYCSCRFSSPGLARHWLPVLTQSRNAFYSTICISAAHDEIMEREFDLAQTRPNEIDRRLRVRAHIIKMINDSVQQCDTSDGTLAAVLHVWFSELIGGDPGLIRVHQKGLNDLIHDRGGLSVLGGEGQLAMTLVINMYLAGCMFETKPDEMYMLHAATIGTDPQTHYEQDFVDSPIYTAGRFHSTSQAHWDDTTFPLMELVRRATEYFYVIHDLDAESSLQRHDIASMHLEHCHRSLLAFTSTITTSTLTKEQGLTEVVRLSCLIFVHALVLRVPLSQAAQDPMLQRAGLSRGQPGSILKELKNALKSSPFEGCWGKRMSVLLWCGIIALASANNMPVDDQELREDRDFIAAATLRAAILQVFSRPVPMLGMLKRFVDIQNVLARGGVKMVKKRSPRSKVIDSGRYQTRITDVS